MATRRAIVAVMSPVAVVALWVSGFLSIWFGLIALVTQFIGTHIGTKIVLKRGEMFATIAMAITILISSILLLISA